MQGRTTPIVTWILILLNSIAFFYELSRLPRELEAFIRHLGMTLAGLSNDAGSYWTLVTCMFLHGG